MSATVFAAPPVLAQRASDDVVASAQDAFGTAIGNESIGLYSSTEARGFSPKDAGNFRIEGLFYEQVGNFGYTNQVARSTTMRVGLSAQSYAFPAPTGIADIRLRLPGSRILKSFSAHHGPYTSMGAQFDIETPRSGSAPGFVMSVSTGEREMDFHTRFYYVDVSGLMHWVPNERVEVISFAQRSHAWEGESPSLVFTAGPYRPPKSNRNIFAGPSFVQERTRTQGNIGFIGRSAISDQWRLQTGIFRSTTRLDGDFSLLWRDTQPSGLADLSIRGRPQSWQSSYSGEARVSGLFAEGPRRHTIHFSGKGRAGRRLFGGDQTVVYGPAFIGTSFDYPKPDFTFGPRSEDTVRHGSAGISYVGLWPGVGELSAGVQKAFYRRTVDYPIRPSATTRTQPWLYNATLAVQASQDLTFYAGYTRGLEDSGIAPENAANPGEALAASLTKQIDAGLRYRLTPTTTFVAGVFEVKKPYFDRDAANIFTTVGGLSHRGVEVSVSSSPLEGLRLVAGAMLLKARVSGFTVDQGLIAEVPPGRPPAVVRVNATYGPAAWQGFSLTGQVSVEGSHYANRLNTVRVETLTTLDLGARYNFTIDEAAASLRFDVQNVTNAYVWTVNSSSGHYSPSPARRYTVRLAADF